jgi:tetratricopeptide (TPR) repeat protein
VDYLVSGVYDYDGRNFSARSQVMDVKRYRLSPEVAESGPIAQTIEVESAVAGDLSRELEKLGGPAAVNPVAYAMRLDALENYVKGISATDVVQRIRLLKEAVRLAPDHAPSLLALGKTYFDNRDYEQASATLAKVPKNDPSASEANFFLGLSQYFQANYQGAEEAFKFTAERAPLVEVFNNLGVIEARRGKREALAMFERAVSADARDADYRFNLAIALYRSGDQGRAVRELKSVVSEHPQDAEAKTFLQGITGAATGQRLPLERVKRNYDESAYRQLALEMENVAEMKHGELPAPKHAEAHVRRGNELLLQGAPDQAENEFREAIVLDPSNALAHAGLAEILEGRNELIAARNEATTANRLALSAQAFLVLARVEMKSGKSDRASDMVERALKIEPSNPRALELQKQLTR